MDLRRCIVGLACLCGYDGRWRYAWSEMDESGKQSND